MEILFNALDSMWTGLWIALAMAAGVRILFYFSNKNKD